MGEPSKASMSSTMILSCSTNLILHTENPMRFGRNGDRVANTPVSRFCFVPAGMNPQGRSFVRRVIPVEPIINLDVRKPFQPQQGIFEAGKNLQHGRV